MRRFSKKQILWGIGLNQEQADSIRAMAGRLYSLELWPLGELPDFTDPGAITMPCLVCFSMDAYRQFMSLPMSQIGFLELTPKALLLDAHTDQAALHEALDYGLDIIRYPLTEKRFASCLRKAAEAAALQRDIQNMAHEVFVEREMLERKNEALSFLVNFLSRISESPDEAEILGRAFSCLQNLFPVITMHAAIFSKDDNGRGTASLFVAAAAGSDAYEAWRARLLEIGTALYQDVNPITVPLPLPGKDAANARPGDGHILTLPVHIGENAHLYLMLLTSMERNLSRDQVVTLDSALRHLAITMKNLRRYQEVCFIADRDSLTGAYNRRHFEQTLHAEIARHERYGDDISLLILDLDHFKKINDSWGHLKGDEVLRSVVNVINGTIRQTDYCIRYGGEEFVVLLPHTSSRNAAWLAERLRRRIEKLEFTAGDKRFGITASLGVASIAVGENKEGSALTSEADQALYQAKNEGRNRVMVYTPDAMEAVSQ